MTGFTKVFGGDTIYPAQLSYRAYALTADITLVWPLNAAVSTNIAPDIMDVTPSGAGFSVLMPDATGTGPGQSILATNLGASAYTLKDNAGGTIQSIAAGTAWDIYLTDNSTVAGTWRAVQRGATTSSASAAALAGLGLIALGSVLNETMAVTTFNSDYGPGPADRAKAFVWTGGSGTLTIAQASTLTSGWFITVRNAGSGVLTAAMAHLGDMINGATTLTLNQGDSCTIFTDNVSAFYTMGLGQAAEFAFDTITIDIGGSGDYVLSGNELNRISYTFTGALTGDRKVVVPDTVQQYWPTNSTTGAHTLTMGNSAQVVSVTLTAGSSNILKDDGANLALAQNGSGFVTPVAVADGGTGATTAAGALINLGGTTVGIAVFEAANAAAARTAIAAGTISTQDANNVTITGGAVSGLTSPLTISGTASTQITATQSDNAAAVGPSLVLDRASASPAASDLIGGVTMSGRDSGANSTVYGQLVTRIDDATDGSEDSTVIIRSMVAGVLTDVATFGASGTFTPGLAFGGAAVGMTFSARTGTYVKNGALVIWSVNITLSAKGSSTGSATITGLPFTGSFDGTVGALLPSSNMAGLTAGGNVYLSGGIGTTTGIRVQTTTGSQALTEANFANTSSFYASGWFVV